MIPASLFPFLFLFLSFAFPLPLRPFLFVLATALLLLLGFVARPVLVMSTHAHHVTLTRGGSGLVSAFIVGVVHVTMMLPSLPRHTHRHTLIGLVRVCSPPNEVAHVVH